MARFNPALHPRDKNGKFRKKGGGVSLRKSPRLAAARKNISAARTAYAAYGDITAVGSNSAKAAAWGATGHYVNAGLYGAKAGTAASRLGSTATRAVVARSSFSPSRKQQINTRLNKIDDRTQTVENIATIGLALTGASIRRPVKAYNPGPKKGAAGNYRARKDLGRPVKQNRQGVYQVTKVKRVASAGARVRR